MDVCEQAKKDAYGLIEWIIRDFVHPHFTKRYILAKVTCYDDEEAHSRGGINDQGEPFIHINLRHPEAIFDKECTYVDDWTDIRGSWFKCCSMLICHELAHAIERSLEYEGKPEDPHNDRWYDIYINLSDRVYETFTSELDEAVKEVQNARSRFEVDNMANGVHERTYSTTISCKVN